MFCKSCGNQVADRAEICLRCGVRPLNGTKFCQNCGVETNPAQEICVKCGTRVRGGPAGEPKEWLVTLLLCLFLGGFGVHRFYTGHTTIGVIQLLTLGGCGIWTLIDFIMIVLGNFKDAEGRPLVKR